mgnify:CR=1 FL=1|jgi:uncharacterized phiE125 gp8 family phage protein
MVTIYTTTPTLDDVISVDDLKSHLRVDVSDDDALIEAMRDTAIDFVQQITGRVIGDVDAVVYLDQWQNVTFDVGPVNEISSVQYIDENGGLQTLPTSNWYADLAGPHARIRFHDVPSLFDYSLNRVIVNCNVGHAENAIPAPVIHAIRLLVGHMYENRTAAEIRSVNEIPFGVHSLLSPFRIFA